MRVVHWFCWKMRIGYGRFPSLLKQAEELERIARMSFDEAVNSFETQSFDPPIHFGEVAVSEGQNPYSLQGVDYRFG